MEQNDWKKLHVVFFNERGFDTKCNDIPFFENLPQRYMEIYHLLPNTTYEFRIWGNNYIGPGEIASTIVTTLPEIGDDGKCSEIMV